VIYSEFLLQKFADALTCCPLMDLADIFEAAQASQNNYGYRFCNAAKIAVVFFCCFYLFKEVGQCCSIHGTHYIISGAILKIDFRDA